MEGDARGTRLYISLFAGKTGLRTRLPSGRRMVPFASTRSSAESDEDEEGVGSDATPLVMRESAPSVSEMSP